MGASKMMAALFALCPPVVFKQHFRFRGAALSSSAQSTVSGYEDGSPVYVRCDHETEAAVIKLLGGAGVHRCSVAPRNGGEVIDHVLMVLARVKGVPRPKILCLQVRPVVGWGGGVALCLLNSTQEKSEHAPHAVHRSAPVHARGALGVPFVVGAV